MNGALGIPLRFFAGRVSTSAFEDIALAGCVNSSLEVACPV